MASRKKTRTGRPRNVQRRGARRAAGANARRSSRRLWTRWSDDRLLDMRMCDLNVKLEGTPAERCIKKLYEELTRTLKRVRLSCEDDRLACRIPMNRKVSSRQLRTAMEILLSVAEPE